MSALRQRVHEEMRLRNYSQCTERMYMSRITQFARVIRAEAAKTGRRRTLPLHEDMLAELLRLRAVHAELLGRDPEPTELVFLSPEGHAWCRPSNNVNRVLRRVLAAAGIPRKDGEGRKVDLHSLRHTCASRLARGGVGLVLAQRLLGHSDPKLTARVYSHVEVEDLRGAVVALPATPITSAPLLEPCCG